MLDTTGHAPLSQDDLAQGLKNEELHLLYQPKVNMRTGRVIGAEALLRWRHPVRGDLSPGLFLPLAENTDLIVDIGTWVLRTALRQIAQWQAQRLDLTVSINVAPRQLQQPDFIETLRRCLDEVPEANPARLELEILESAAIQNIEKVREIIQTCRGWGVSFSLDDFGTGYASLSYLRQIPAEVLKIDQTFVRDLLDDEDDQLLVSGVISLAKAFRRVVVAEGVETCAQGILLLRLGCDIVQGYGIARPMPPDRLPDWVAGFQPDPRWMAWIDVPWEMDDLPLLTAEADHRQFVEKIVQYVEGEPMGLTEGEIKDHHQCRFGRWYYHQGQSRYGDMQEFIEIEHVHRGLHELVTEIVGAYDSGDVERARELLPALRKIERTIVLRLHDLQTWVVNRSTRQQAMPMRVMNQSFDNGGDEASIKGLSPVQVLIVDDVPANIELLAGALSRDYTVKFATSGTRALEIMAQPGRPDLVLLDVLMPEMDGYEVCRRLKEDAETRNTPIIFITAKSDLEDQIRGFKVGAVDFIIKPFQLPIVLARVRTHVSLKLRTDLLESRAALDGLTGVPNRRQLDEVLGVECRRAQRNLMPLALLMVDVDHFKEYNDHYGHGAGDECLRQIGMVLSMARRRPGDFVARYGGEEFVVVLPGCNLTVAASIADRIRHMVESLHLPHAYSDAGRYVTVSIGAASCRLGSAFSPDILLQESDLALYRAKQGGRNRIELFDVDRGEEGSLDVVGDRM